MVSWQYTNPEKTCVIYTDKKGDLHSFRSDSSEVLRVLAEGGVVADYAPTDYDLANQK